MPPTFCPNCGTAVPSGVRACPECGADEETGWSDEAHAQGLGIPDEDFDYEEFVEREFCEENTSLKPKGLLWFWWIVGLGLLTALIMQWVL